jgi:hypothetical protein
MWHADDKELRAKLLSLGLRQFKPTAVAGLALDDVIIYINVSGG